MKAYGVPWNTLLTTHKLHKILDKQGQTKSLVSELYSLLSVATYKSLYIQQVWFRDLGIPTEDGSRKRIWETIADSSKNPIHQQTHFSFSHRTYHTPRKRYLMKLISSPIGDLCPDSQTGLFMHMFWDCRDVAHFWRQVCLTSYIKYLI